MPVLSNELAKTREQRGSTIEPGVGSTVDLEKHKRLHTLPTVDSGKTTLTDQTVRDVYVPEIDRKLSDAEKQFQLDPDTQEYLDDREEISTSLDEGTFQDPVTRAIDEARELSSARVQSDIDLINTNFSRYIADQERLNKQTNAATGTALLLGGSLRYTISSEGIMKARVEDSMRKVQQLESEQRALVTQARAAQAEDDLELVIDKLEHIAQRKKEVDAEIQAIHELQRDEIQKLQERNNLAQREQSIAEVFDFGITDASDIQGVLKDQYGITTSLEEIEGTLGIINPPESLAGLNADMKTALFVKNNPEQFPEMKGKNVLDILQALENKNQQRFDTQKVGDTLYEFEYDDKGQIIGRKAIVRDESDQDENRFKFSNDDRGKLLGVGLSESEIDRIQSDTRQYGADAVIEGMGDEKQKIAIRAILKNMSEEKIQEEQEAAEKFLDKDYFSGLFTKDQLESAAKDAGFTAGGFLGAGVGKKGVSDYLDHLVNLVEQYRKAGFTDKEILKQMQ